MAGNLELDAQTYADWGVDYLKASLLLSSPTSQNKYEGKYALISPKQRVVLRSNLIFRNLMFRYLIFCPQ